MSRYSYYGDERDAYDEGHRGYFGGNPYDHDPQRRAWEEGYDDQRRERERREEQEAEERQREHEERRRQEEAAYEEAMYEQQAYEPESPTEEPEQ